MIQAGIRHLLITDSGINALVERRVYPVRVPEEGVAPCLTYQVSSTDYPDGLDLDGTTAESQGPDTMYMRLRCWGDGADGYTQAWTLANLVVEKLRAHSGLLGPAAAGSARKCKYIRVDDASDEELVFEDAADLHKFCVVVDVKVVYEPSEA